MTNPISREEQQKVWEAVTIPVSDEAKCEAVERLLAQARAEEAVAVLNELQEFASIMRNRPIEKNPKGALGELIRSDEEREAVNELIEAENHVVDEFETKIDHLITQYQTGEKE